jgi:hypothetical protein
MKNVEVEALMTFKYSPNGFDTRIVEQGLEFEVTEVLAKKLTAGDPPRARRLSEPRKGEIVPDEIVEEEELVIEEVFEEEELPIEEEVELPFSELEDVEINGELIEENEVVEEFGGEYENFPAYKSIIDLDELKDIINKASKKDDEIELGPKFSALRKGGAWYNVYNKVTDEVENETGMKMNDKMAEFVYELYLKK